MDIYISPLERPLPAKDRDGTPIILNTIGEAATLLVSAVPESKRTVIWQHAYKSLESAVREPSSTHHATEAVRELLISEGLFA
jgi:hypothetical protein